MGLPSGIRIPKSGRLFRVFVTLLVAGTALAGGTFSQLAPQAHAYTPDAFVMVVKTDNPGVSDALSFTIPTTGTGYSYNVDCNDDGTNEITARTTSYTCVYGSAGTYTVAITGTFPRIYFNNGGDKQKLLEVQQWGTGAWMSMANAFYGASNMHVTAMDAPNLAGVTSLAGMFRTATVFNEDINHWNTANVTSLAQAFYGATAFNQPLNNWDTSNVTTLSETFYGATAFNQPIGSWDTSKVTSFYRTFRGASGFNELLASWNIGAATTLAEMFYGAVAYNHDMTSWNTANVTTLSQTFRGASSFNGDIAGWDTSKVTSMYYMFYYASSFNRQVGSWDTSSVTNMSWMFAYANSFNQPINYWDVSNVTDMRAIFTHCYIFNQPLDNWDTSSLVSLYGMFAHATKFNQNINNWDVSKSTSMGNLFLRATSFNQPLDNWDTSSMTTMYQTFLGADSFNQSLNAWNTSSVTSMEYTFYSAKSFNQPLDGWDVSNVTIMSGMFYGAGAFNQDISGWNVSSVVDVSSMFHSAVSFNHNLGAWNISNVANMEAMFDYSGFKAYEITLDGWASHTIPSNITLGAAGVTYCNEASRAALIAAPNNWTINDGGYCPPTSVRPVNLEVVKTSNPVFSGIATANRTVNIAIDGASRTVVADASGMFSFTTVTPLSDGWHNVTMSSTDSQGTPGAAVTLAIYVIADSTSAVSGDSQSPTITWPQAPKIMTDSDWSLTATGSASFSRRLSSEAVSFNDKIWVTGGRGSSPYKNDLIIYLNDIWSSPDGVSWTEELTIAPWTARYNHQTVVFNDKMWLFGGQTGSTAATRVNDIWSSDDGTTSHIEQISAGRSFLMSSSLFSAEFLLVWLTLFCIP